MKYFHRTSVSPDEAVSLAASFFADRMSPTEEGRRRRSFSSPLGQLSVSVEAEGGHYTLITVATNQPGESELDRLAKRFLSIVHTTTHEGHDLRGAY